MNYHRPCRWLLISIIQFGYLAYHHADSEYIALLFLHQSQLSSHVGLDIHDALIVGTGMVYRNILKKEVKIITEDKEIRKSNILDII